MASFVIPDGYDLNFHRTFKKQYKKLPSHIARKVDQRIVLLMNDIDDPKLRVHTLKGSLIPLLSFDVTHDYRVWFLIDDTEKLIRIYRVGTHSELYR